MAERKIAETKMVVKKNRDGVSAGKPNQMKKEFKPIVFDVFPAKKRLVKTMIFHYMVHKFCSAFHCGPSQNGKSRFGIVSEENKRKKIVPSPTF